MDRIERITRIESSLQLGAGQSPYVNEFPQNPESILSILSIYSILLNHIILSRIIIDRIDRSPR